MARCRRVVSVDRQRVSHIVGRRRVVFLHDHHVLETVGVAAGDRVEVVVRYVAAAENLRHRRRMRKVFVLVPTTFATFHDCRVGAGLIVRLHGSYVLEGRVQLTQQHAVVLFDLVPAGLVVARATAAVLVGPRIEGSRAHEHVSVRDFGRRFADRRRDRRTSASFIAALRERHQRQRIFIFLAESQQIYRDRVPLVNRFIVYFRTTDCITVIIVFSLVNRPVDIQ